MIDEATLLFEQVERDVVRLTFNRPPANAFDSGVLRRVLQTLRDLRATARPPAIVMTGQGDGFFSAGGDIKEIEREGPQAALSRMTIFHAVLCELENYPAPIIAGVRGFAVGGAFEFVLFADFAIADSGAKFGFPEINHGLLPAAKGIRQAAALLGPRMARSLLYSGHLIDAERAMTAGAIDEIVDITQVDARAVAIARELRAKDPLLFSALKRSVAKTNSLSDDDLARMALDDMRAYLGRAETAEARDRFLKRKDREELE